MPEFVAKEPEHQEWKRKVLAREIELEDIDTTHTRNALASAKAWPSRNSPPRPRLPRGQPDIWQTPLGPPFHDMRIDGQCSQFSRNDAGDNRLPY